MRHGFQGMTVLFLLICPAVGALSPDDFPDGQCGVTTNKYGQMTQLDFDPGWDDFKTKFYVNGLPEDQAFDAFFLHLFFFPYAPHAQFPEYKTWLADQETQRKIQTILKTRLSKECLAQPTDRLKALCWLKSLLKAKKIQITLGEFAVENGRNVFLENDIPLPDR